MKIYHKRLARFLSLWLAVLLSLLCFSPAVLAAGSEDISLSAWDRSEALNFTFVNMVPGDSEMKEYAIKVTDKKAVYIQFSADIISGDKLAEALSIKVLVNGDGVYDGALADMGTLTHEITGSLPQTVSYNVTFYMATSVTSEYAGLSLETDLKWTIAREETPVIPPEETTTAETTTPVVTTPEKTTTAETTTPIVTTPEETTTAETTTPIVTTPEETTTAETTTPIVTTPEETTTVDTTSGPSMFETTIVWESSAENAVRDTTRATTTVTTTVETTTAETTTPIPTTTETTRETTAEMTTPAPTTAESTTETTTETTTVIPPIPGYCCECCIGYYFPYSCNFKFSGDQDCDLFWCCNEALGIECWCPWCWIVPIIILIVIIVIIILLLCRKKFGDYCDDWIEKMEEEKEKPIDPITLEKHKNAVDNHIKPQLGKVLPKKLTPEKMAEFTKYLSTATFTDVTMVDVLVTLNGALDYCREKLGDKFPNVSAAFPTPNDKGGADLGK